jgi:aminopeptidase N
MTCGRWTRGAAVLWLAPVWLGVPATAVAPTRTAPIAAAAAAAPAVVHYDARVDVDVEHGRVSGTVTMTAVAGEAGATELRLDSGDLVVDAARVDGRPAVFNSADRRLTIAMPHPVARGKRIDVSVTYHGQPRAGVRFFADRRQAYTVFSTSHWMVCDDAPGRKATLKLTVTTPDPDVTVIGSGRRADGGAWVIDTPTSTYLFAFAVGRFHGVTATERDVKLIYQSESFSDDELRAIFRETPAMLAFFEERSGVPYRGVAYTQVLAAGSVEQEAGQLTLLNEDSGRALLKDPSDVWLEAHELAHQWWGNGVTCRAWTDFWLNEGLATFMADAYKERRFGREAYLKEIEASRARYERVRDAGHDHALVYADWTHPTAADRTIVYHKGAYVLHMLREQLGDEVFWRALRAYTRAFMGKSVGTVDFQQAMERASRVDLAAFFRRWIYSTGGGV